MSERCSAGERVRAVTRGPEAGKSFVNFWLFVGRKILYIEARQQLKATININFNFLHVYMDESTYD